jgi:two-component system chemotaxis response regulator CheY
MAKVIMTADDSATIREIIRFALTAQGYTVVEAADGSDALKKATAAPIDMLITDLNMPVMDGIELIRRMRALPNYKFIPIVMLTTESTDTKKQAGKAAGATAWIVKPFKPEDLVGVVKKVLR